MEGTMIKNLDKNKQKMYSYRNKKYGSYVERYKFSNTV
jgi:hypothetical protein